MNEAVLRFAIPALWAAWMAYWLARSFAVKRARWREPLASAAVHMAPLVVAAFLFAEPRDLPAFLNERFLPRTAFLSLFGLCLLVIGLAVAIWARRHLGRNWSGRVTLKQNHALIETGPYRLVRHPIYSGLLIALLGTAIAIGEWRALLGFALILFGLLYKAGIEEGRMRDAFPEYAEYRRRTKAIVPFLY